MAAYAAIKGLETIDNELDGRQLVTEEDLRHCGRQILLNIEFIKLIINKC